MGETSKGWGGGGVGGWGGGGVGGGDIQMKPDATSNSVCEQEERLHKEMLPLRCFTCLMEILK